MNEFTDEALEAMFKKAAATPPSFGPYFSRRVIASLSLRAKVQDAGEDAFHGLFSAFCRLGLAAAAACTVLSLWIHFHPSNVREANLESEIKLDQELDAASYRIVEELL
jgi:hypothetical protein